MFFKIYKTTNLINGKIYIGQTHYDKQTYFGSGVLVTQAIKKYGAENFIKEYIDEAYSQGELDQKEMFWIKELNSQDKNIGYNIADGGWNYFTMTDETKRKISQTLKGKYVGNKAFRNGVSLTNTHKDAISKALNGKPLSDNHKEKISKSLIGKEKTDEHKKNLSISHTGKTLSDEHKRNISEGGKGRVYTDKQKERLRLANIDKKQKHSKTISVECILSKEKLNFNNISSAARHFNVTRQRIKNNSVEDWQITVNND